MPHKYQYAIKTLNNLIYGYRKSVQAKDGTKRGKLKGNCYE